MDESAFVRFYNRLVGLREKDPQEALALAARLLAQVEGREDAQGIAYRIRFREERLALLARLREPRRERNTAMPEEAPEGNESRVIPATCACTECGRAAPDVVFGRTPAGGTRKVCNACVGAKISARARVNGAKRPSEPQPPPAAAAVPVGEALEHALREQIAGDAGSILQLARTLATLQGMPGEAIPLLLDVTMHAVRVQVQASPKEY